MNWQRMVTISIVVTSLLSWGCSTISPAVTYYSLLNTEGQNFSEPTKFNDPIQDHSMAIQIGPVNFPRYLQRSQIVTRSQGAQLTINEFHRWGSKLEEEMLAVLRDNLSSLLSSPRVVVYPETAHFPLDYHIVIDVHRFDGILGKDVSLNTRWMIVDPTTHQALHIMQSDISQAIRDESYDALVTAHNLALMQLSQEIKINLVNYISKLD